MMPLNWRTTLHPNQNKNCVNQRDPQILYKNQMPIHHLREQSLWRKQAAQLMKANGTHGGVLQ